MPKVREPFVAIYAYDYDSKIPDNIAQLWVNGESAGWTSASAPIAMTSRKVIGRHGGKPWNFCGDIAEVMIFDEGLDASEVGTLTRSLAEKYGVELPSTVKPESTSPAQ